MSNSKPSGLKFNLDFPMTFNSAMESHVRDRVGWVCEYILEYLGAHNIKAIILSGSIAQGEGSVLEDANGTISLLSDLDIAIVVNKQATESLTMNNELNSALNSAAPPEFLSPIDTIIWTPEQARRWWMTPYIVTLQLLGTAQVLWGDKEILPTIPPFSQEDILDKDIFKLFNNRIAEQIFYFVRYQNSIDKVERFVYHSAKASVDTVLAACVAARCFLPGLLDRLEKFQDLCSDPLLGLDMVEWAYFWTKFKITPDLRMLAGRFMTQDVDKAALASWKETAGFLIRLLHWTAKTRLGLDEEKIEPLIIHLSKKFGFSHSYSLSLKDFIFHPHKSIQNWQKHYLSSHFAKEINARNLPLPKPRRAKKLAALGSARSLTYAAAALLLAAIGRSVVEQQKLLKRASYILPTAKPVYLTDLAKWRWSLAVEIGRLWNILVMDGRR